MDFGRTILSKSPNFSKQSSSLGLYFDNGLLRLRGRFHNCSIGEDQKHPIILHDVSSRFTKLVIIDGHEKTMHQGLEATLGQVRRRFWIVKGRKAIKAVIKKCTICKRHQGRTMTSPASPDLPDFRLNFEAKAFSSVEIDFAGPIFYRKFFNCKSIYFELNEIDFHHILPLLSISGTNTACTPRLAQSRIFCQANKIWFSFSKLWYTRMGSKFSRKPGRRHSW